jgi:hypothetical protein
VPAILDGKQRLFNSIRELCHNQERAAFKYVSAQKALQPGAVTAANNAVNTAGKLGINATVIDLTDRSKKNVPVTTVLTGNLTYAQTDSFVKRRRGVLFTGRYDHFHDIFQAVFSLRLLNVNLPVEVWVNARDMKLCQDVFDVNKMFKRVKPAPEGILNGAMSPSEDAKNAPITCLALPNSVRGFASKFYSLLSTKLTDVLFMDADNIAVRDVNEVFDSEAYQLTGSVLWPDLWGDSCRGLKDQAQPPAGDSAFKNHVFWVAKFGGKSWSNTRDVAQEAEAGQIALDMTRHAGLLEIGRKFIEDDQFLKNTVNGDKDIFRLVHIVMEEPFHYVPHLPAYSFAQEKRDCLVHFFGGTSAEQPPSKQIGTVKL